MRTHQSRERGAALLLLLVFFMVGSLVVTLGIGRTAYFDAARNSQSYSSAQAFFTMESALEDAVYRTRKAQSISATETLALNGASATTTISNTGLNTQTAIVVATKDGAVRTGKASLHLGNGASFNFGLQSNTGGISLANSSAVIGNVYSNGPVTGANNYIYGDVVSAGPSGLISGIHATSSAYAHTIQNSTIDKDAYYQSISSTLVSGSSCVNAHCHPGSTDQATSSLPLTDQMITDWETTAAAGGTYSGPCPYTIDSDTSIGPIKIPCDVTVDKSSTDVTLNGPVWITGNLDTKNGPTFHAGGSSGESTIIIADDPSNRATSSVMTLDQSTGFIGAAGDSYVLMVSMNSGAASGTSQTAISAGNRTTTGEKEVIYYAPYGKITAAQSVGMRGATAYLIALTQSATVQYETGMISLLFTGGAGGAFTINSWQEIE